MKIKSSKKGEADEINTLADYSTVVTNICSAWTSSGHTAYPWLRGQSDESWDLLPSLYRGEVNSFYERELLRDFKLRAHLLVDKPPASDLEWLFVMQHHGLPTRLLDWTESNLTALYFAVVSGGTADAAVWILDPWSLNKLSIKQQSAPTADHPTLKNYVLRSNPENFSRLVSAKIPVAIRPVRSTGRIVNQKGMFTLHGKEQRGLNEIVGEMGRGKIRLEKLVIPGKRKNSLLVELFSAGTSHGNLFPDLDGLAREIRFSYSAAFTRIRSEHLGSDRSAPRKKVIRKGSGKTTILYGPQKSTRARLGAQPSAGNSPRVTQRPYSKPIS